jgi:lipoyl-dependent peroxiredoxin subunit D
MSIDTLKARLPDYAKDLRLNPSSLATEPVLTEQQRATEAIQAAVRIAAVVHAVAATLDGEPALATRAAA